MERKITIKEAYELDCTLNNRLRDAKEAGDEARMQATRADINKLYGEIGTGAFESIYSAYQEAKKIGNEYIDLHWCIWDREVDGLISCMRENDIDHFTFSSLWSNAIEIALLFTKKGCTVEGLVEINGYKKVPAYLFKVN